VGAPDAPASLDTERIALSRTPNTMDYFANAAWSDRVPVLVQRLLIQTFDASNRIVAVDRDTTGLENDYVLQTEIRDFEARYDTRTERRGSSSAFRPKSRACRSARSSPASMRRSRRKP
jgi:cholesterol transport system auxiliary component